MVAHSKNTVGLGRALMNSRGGGKRVTRGGGGAGTAGRGRNKGPMEMVCAAAFVGGVYIRR